MTPPDRRICTPDPALAKALRINFRAVSDSEPENLAETQGFEPWIRLWSV